MPRAGWGDSADSVLATRLIARLTKEPDVDLALDVDGTIHESSGDILTLPRGSRTIGYLTFGRSTQAAEALPVTDGEAEVGPRRPAFSCAAATFGTVHATVVWVGSADRSQGA